MPDRVDEIRDLYAFNRWANARMLDAVEALEAEARERHVVSSFPSIHATVLHALAAEWIWLRRWKGTSPTGMPEGWGEMDFTQLRSAWSVVEAEQGHFVAELEPDDLDRVLEYRTMAGLEGRQPLWQMLRHVVNHATYHRGQLVTQLRQVGATPPATDMVLYHRETLG